GQLGGGLLERVARRLDLATAVVARADLAVGLGQDRLERRVERGRDGGERGVHVRLARAHPYGLLATDALDGPLVVPQRRVEAVEGRAVAAHGARVRRGRGVQVVAAAVQLG